MFCEWFGVWNDMSFGPVRRRRQNDLKCDWHFSCPPSILLDTHPPLNSCSRVYNCHHSCHPTSNSLTWNLTGEVQVLYRYLTEQRNGLKLKWERKEENAFQCRTVPFAIEGKALRTLSTRTARMIWQTCDTMIGLRTTLPKRCMYTVHSHVHMCIYACIS